MMIQLIINAMAYSYLFLPQPSTVEPSQPLASHEDRLQQQQQQQQTTTTNNNNKQQTTWC
jgi:hypothetical protein